MNSKTQNKRIFYRALAGISLYVPCKEEEQGKPELDYQRPFDRHRYRFFAFLSGMNRITPIPGKRLSIISAISVRNYEENALVEFAFPLLRNLVGGLPQSVCGVIIEPYDREICLDRSRMAEYDFFVHAGAGERKSCTAAERMHA